LSARPLTSNQSGKAISLDFEARENYYEAEDIRIGGDPQELTFTCATQEGSCVVSPIVQQDVISRSGIVSMAVVAIVLVGVDLAIVSFQFCTFHHKKHD
jgi:hypothetical protein